METGAPQPASAVLGHEGMMLPELIGMLRLNSLMFVKRLVIFWWKVLGGGCAVQGCDARRGCVWVDGLVLKSGPEGWSGKLPNAPGLLVGKPAQCRKTGSCKRASPALSHGWLLGVGLQSAGLVHSMQNVTVGHKMQN